MKIGVAFDLAPDRPTGDGPDDRFEEFDKPETVEAIAGALRSEGHQVVLLGDGRDLIARVLDDPPDFVWNLAEGQGVGRNREARVPALLEMLDIPYSGSDPLTLAATLDKGVAKRLVQCEGVAVPGGVAITVEEGGAAAEARVAALGAAVGYPLIVKPAFEGSSKGIRGRCLVNSSAEAVAVCRDLAHDYGQPVLVEEFIAGDELTVGVIGNGAGAAVLGVMRIRPRQPEARFVYSLDVKRDWINQVEYEVPARLSEELLERVGLTALAAYRALNCRDFARIDFRLREGTPYFLEANPLPGLAPGTSDLVILARGLGVGHADLIRRVLRAALARVGPVSRRA